MSRKSNKKMQSIQNVLAGFELKDKGGYITQEFQDYGYRLACEMGEEKKKSMYIKMAKDVDRGIMERARTFVLDAENVRNRGRLFVWAVNKMKKGEELSSG